MDEHTKAMLEKEKEKLIKVIRDNAQANKETDRRIKQAQAFPGKREDEHRRMKEEYNELSDLLEKLNDDILARSWKLD
jgi:hypothetical protein